MDAAYAERFPVLTFASGPTNSIRGAAFLSGVAEAIVVDIGGTTSDVGALHKGFPRPATVAVEVGGVRTNFRMPDVFSFGLGGGSLVVDGPNGVTVGPSSVGYRLTTEALVFGGSTLTTSDVVVAAGARCSATPTRSPISTPGLIARTEARIAEMLEAAVERSRLSPEPLPVIVVGGGSILVKGKIGGLEVIKPNHFAVANAVGAAIAQVSGEIDRVYSLAAMSRADAIKRRRGEGDARSRWPPARARIRLKWSMSRTCRSPICPATRRACMSRWSETCMSRDGYVAHARRISCLSSLGAALLGTGGGGNPYIGMLRPRELMRARG